MTRPYGAFVDEVQAGSPAEAAGIENNDIIIAFNQRSIEASSQLPFYVGQVRPGTEAILTVVRDGDTLQLPVTVGSLPGSGLASMDRAIEPPRGNTLGLTVSQLRDEERGSPGTGVRIDEVDEDGPAASAGLTS